MEYNPFEILDLEPTQDASAIKRAYRKLAKQHHPDVGGNAEAFARVQRAYEVLTTPQLYEEWQRTGTEPGAKRSEEDERRKHVRDILLQHIEAALQEDEYTCLVEEVRSTLQQHEKELRQMITMAQKDRAIAEKRLGRIKRGELLQSVLRQKIEELDRGIAKAEQGLEFIALAQKEASEMEEEKVERSEAKPDEQILNDFLQSLVGHKVQFKI